MCRRVLTRVFARRTRRFVTPSNHRGYLRLAKALIRLLRSVDVQSQSVQADPSLRTSFIVGFAMHRLLRPLFVQTLTLSTLGTIFSRRHFEIFFSFFQENIICTSCKLSPLHETSNPVFLVIKRKKKKENEFNLSSVSSYKFYCRFCHAQTLAPVVCANLNSKHPGYNFQQTTF